MGCLKLDNYVNNHFQIRGLKDIEISYMMGGKEGEKFMNKQGYKMVPTDIETITETTSYQPVTTGPQGSVTWTDVETTSYWNTVEYVPDNYVVKTRNELKWKPGVPKSNVATGVKNSSDYVHETRTYGEQSVLSSIARGYCSIALKACSVYSGNITINHDRVIKPNGN